jgi:hypothetical protein
LRLLGHFGSGPVDVLQHDPHEHTIIRRVLSEVGVYYK